ncbi:MAG: polysaccharide deacetylase family protein [Butyrivibrio sp.]|uniref:polysaccharide deacetylase family protein n=1 Tax=Butyrivibrio sp. TaxID=28121 RepID=UPI0025D43A17|nr:polysaccharide deacetylase family protein [Butyrivibrio sp.]MCR5771728.1 polysaccharide deacetylase family protein [Butyrivibrio sp.]
MANMTMRFPQGRPKALTLSYDDGVEQDIRLIEIAKENGIKGTFNINSGLFAPEDVEYKPGTIHRRMPLSKVLEVYKNSDFEIAAHAYTHAALTGLPSNVAADEILKDRKVLERLFGTIIRGFAYPYGAYDDNSVSILKNCGMCYARTVNSTHDFRIPSDWLRLPATCHHNDPMLMELAHKFVEENKSLSPMLFYLWGHTYEFEQKDNWNVIEEFCKYMSGRDDIWYATNIEIYDYCNAFSQLIFDTDMTMCQNPTCTDIWFTYDEKDVFVPAGEKVKF